MYTIAEFTTFFKDPAWRAHVALDGQFRRTEGETSSSTQ